VAKYWQLSWVWKHHT